MIAKGLADLHGDTIELARLGNNMTKLSALTEKGEIVPGLNDNPDPKDRTWAYASSPPEFNRHEMLTGSTTDGRAYTDASSTAPATIGRAAPRAADRSAATSPARRPRSACPIAMAAATDRGIRRIRPAAAARSC